MQICNSGPYMVFFDWDRSDLKGGYSFDMLDNAVAQYANCGNMRIVLSGHADKSGASAYNIALSERRNATVRAALITRGVLDSAVSTISFGESTPIVQTTDGVREPQNRRVEIQFVRNEPSEGAD
jgi:OmpA-OmpF porin, OOP family